jgi:hypothetical protein
MREAYKWLGSPGLDCWRKKRRNEKVSNFGQHPPREWLRLLLTGLFIKTAFV